MKIKFIHSFIHSFYLVWVIFIVFATIFGVSKVNLKYNQIKGEISILNDKVENQQRMINILNNTIMSLETKNRFSINCTDERFNYLAIGNSITKHGVCDYWRSESGMAASKPINDYFNVHNQLFRNNGYDVHSCAINFGEWEYLSHDRSQAIGIINGYLNSNIDLITVQLGENVSNLSTFESDFIYLLDYLKSRCPKAKIIVIGDFWLNDGLRNDMKYRACSDTSCVFIDLSAISGKEEYKCGMNTSVYDNIGQVHLVQHAGVAEHPNDKAMKFIAEKIFLRY